MTLEQAVTEQIKIQFPKNVNGLKTESNEIEKEVPLELPNPNYPKFKKSNQHLQDIAISDCDI